MNRRSLILVFTMTIILFAVNQYFGGKKQKAMLAQKEAQQEQMADEASANAATIARRTAKVQDFPLVEIYKDDQKTDFATWAVDIKGAFLTLSWEKDLPEKVYTKSQELQKFAGKNKVGSPILYVKSEVDSLDIANLPYTSKIDVQLLTFGDKGTVNVHLGEFENNFLFFPGGYPESNALVFFKWGSRYLPVGFYNLEKKRYDGFGSLRGFQDIVKYQKVSVPQTVEDKETYYVLENGTQQMVFSNVGGAIAEINLPFISNQNPDSVVRPIGFDKKIKKSSPNNARFPLHGYYAVGADGKLGYQEPKTGGYYPLLRRDILKDRQNPAFNVPPKYYAMSTVSQYPETAQMIYSVKSVTKDSIVFEATSPQRRITKSYSFPKDVDAPYVMDMKIKVEGDSRGLYLNTGVPEVELISGSPAPVLKYRATQNGKSSTEKISLPKHSFEMSNLQPDWICNSNGFFGLILDPLSEIEPGIRANNIPGELDQTRLSLIDPQHNLYPVNKYPGYEMFLPLKASSQEVSFRLYAGPFDQKVLKQVDAALTDPVTGYNPQYIGAQSFHGWFSFISEPFAKFLMVILNFFYTITHSWGFSIILLTVVLRIMLYPLNAWSIKSSLKMQQVNPKIKAIQEKYKKDPKRVQLETMQVYRENGVNPFTGCIPLLIQMPFLIGMFDLLKSSFQLRGASFIPGWINNLTAPDVLFSWGTPIIFFGTSFHLLPFILGIAMYFQQKFTMQSKGALTDQQKQQQKMGSFMTIIFTLLFYNFPSGLNIYWLSSMLLAILQQWLTAKRMSKNAIVIKK